MGLKVTGDGADIVGKIIDAESSGNHATLTALDLATQVVTAARQTTPQTFLVMAPRYGLSWEPENLLFIRFLAQGLRTTSSRLMIVHTDPDEPAIPSGWSVDWLNAPPPECGSWIERRTTNDEPRITHHASRGLLSLVPGVIAPHIADMFLAHDQTGPPTRLRLANGYWLIAPECRQGPRQVSRFAYDRLAMQAEPIKWLQAYAQFYGNNLYVDPTRLCAEAGERFGEGGHHIAFRLIERATACAKTSLERSSIQAQAQSMRIALQWFEEAAAVEPPSPTLPPPLRSLLLLYKAWGVSMVGEPSQAELYFRDAFPLLEPRSPERAYLYVLNIYALNRLKVAGLEEALTVEQEIESKRAKQPIRDWHLEYINSINIARLHRQRRDFKAAERYYNRAFSTTLGVRSESDAVYANFCVARLQADQDRSAEAFAAWLRTGLHWVSSTAPEALAPRAAMAILRRKAAVGEEVTEAVSAALLQEMARAARAVGLEIEPPTPEYLKTARVPVFIHIDHGPESQVIECAIGAPGWSILVTRASCAPQFTGERHQLLCLYVSQLLKVICPVRELGAPDTIAVDDQFGCEMPSSPVELLKTCLWRDVPKIVFGKECIELEPESRHRLKSDTRVRLGRAVNRVEMNGAGASVTFKRYLPPKSLSTNERLILTLLDDHSTVEDLAAHAQAIGSVSHVLEIVRALEQSRIVALDLSEESCIRAGLTLPAYDTASKVPYTIPGAITSTAAGPSVEKTLDHLWRA